MCCSSLGMPGPGRGKKASACRKKCFRKKNEKGTWRRRWYVENNKHAHTHTYATFPLKDEKKEPCSLASDEQDDAPLIGFCASLLHPHSLLLGQQNRMRSPFPLFLSMPLTSFSPLFLPQCRMAFLPLFPQVLLLPHARGV